MIYTWVCIYIHVYVLYIYTYIIYTRIQVYVYSIYICVYVYMHDTCAWIPNRSQAKSKYGLSEARPRYLGRQPAILKYRLLAEGTRCLGLDTQAWVPRVATSNPEIQAIGSWGQIHRLRYLGRQQPAILKYTLLAAGLKYLGSGTQGSNNQQSGNKMQAFDSWALGAQAQVPTTQAGNNQQS